MYNLIIGAPEGALPADRMLEGMGHNLDSFLRPNGTVETARLLSLPAMSMPEIGDTRNDQVAQVGTIFNLSLSSNTYHFSFIRDAQVPPISSKYITASAAEFGIGDREFRRTHWVVKEKDLYQLLIAKHVIGIPKSTAFTLPALAATPNQIAVMMPFSAEFDMVWETLKSTADDNGWVCQRADDVWDDSVLINDVVALIAHSKTVICDLTGRNANVFYETGIAHTLGREVVLITQSPDDVPFDLKHHRFIKYLANSEGLVRWRN